MHDRLMFLLDGAIVVGSLFTLTWATALGAVVRRVAHRPGLRGGHRLPADRPHPGRHRRAPRRHPPGAPAVAPQLWLLGSGLVAISASDSIFAYLVQRRDEMPPLTNVGFIAGPLLIAVAARTAERSATRRRRTHDG